MTNYEWKNGVRAQHTATNTTQDLSLGRTNLCVLDSIEFSQASSSSCVFCSVIILLPILGVQLLFFLVSWYVRIGFVYLTLIIQSRSLSALFLIVPHPTSLEILINKWYSPPQKIPRFFFCRHLFIVSLYP